MTIQIKNRAAQGDIYVVRVASLPDGVRPMAPVDGRYILAHSETGHHHVIDAVEGVVKAYETNDPMTSYVRVLESCDEVEILLRHLRPHDTHQAYAFNPGIYRIRRQREYIPNGWRRAPD